MMIRNLPLDLLPASVNVYGADDQMYGTYVRYFDHDVSIVRCYTQDVAEHLAAGYSEREDVLHAEAITLY